MRPQLLPELTDGEPEAGDAPVSARFTPSLNAPRQVRALFRAILRELEFDDAVIETGILAASELAANAVLHAHTPFRVSMRPRSDFVWIGVEDEAPLADRRALVARAPHGLGLVAAVALRWGVSFKQAGKVVWAEIPVSE